MQKLTSIILIFLSLLFQNRLFPVFIFLTLNNKNICKAPVEFDTVIVNKNMLHRFVNIDSASFILKKNHQQYYVLTKPSMFLYWIVVCPVDSINKPFFKTTRASLVNKK